MNMSEKWAGTVLVFRELPNVVFLKTKFDLIYFHVFFKQQRSKRGTHFLWSSLEGLHSI